MARIIARSMPIFHHSLSSPPMSIVRFFFGHGWWILWYLAFYLILLISVVLTLAMFGSEVKPAGAAPNTPSPASIMVFLIGLGLIFVTLVNLCIVAASASWSWYGKAALIVLVPIAIGVVAFPLNGRLATEQSYPSLWANLIVSLVVIIGNLLLMSVATRSISEPSGGTPSGGLVREL
jgi:hypothetical protein